MDLNFAYLVLSIVLGFFGLIAALAAIAVAIALGYPKVGKESLKRVGEFPETISPKNREQKIKK